MGRLGKTPFSSLKDSSECCFALEALVIGVCAKSNIRVWHVMLATPMFMQPLCIHLLVIFTQVSTHTRVAIVHTRLVFFVVVEKANQRSYVRSTVFVANCSLLEAM